MNDQYAPLAQRPRLTLPLTDMIRTGRDVAADQELAWAIAEAEDRGAWAEAARLRSERFARRRRPLQSHIREKAVPETNTPRPRPALLPRGGST